MSQEAPPVRKNARGSITLGCDAHEPKGVCDLESAKTALEWCRELGLNRIEYPELKKPCRK